MVFDILTYSFIQRAIVSGVAIALLCSIVGMFLVLRRYSLFGDAIAHSSFGGIAVGLLIGVYPIWTAYIISLSSAIIITKIKKSFSISGESSVAILLSSGISIGLILISISGGFTIDIFSFLFGSILLVNAEDTIIIILLTITILIVVLIFYRPILYSTFNEEQAQISGINVEKINYLLISISVITVVTSIQLVGILLISSLLVIPNITAILYGKSFKNTVLLSMTISTSSVVIGILFSYVLDITSSGTIVLISIIIFIVTVCLKSLGLINQS